MGKEICIGFYATIDGKCALINREDKEDWITGAILPDGPVYWTKEFLPDIDAQESLPNEITPSQQQNSEDSSSTTLTDTQSSSTTNNEDDQVPTDASDDGVPQPETSTEEPTSDVATEPIQSAAEQQEYRYSPPMMWNALSTDLKARLNAEQDLRNCGMTFYSGDINDLQVENIFVVVSRMISVQTFELLTWQNLYNTFYTVLHLFDFSTQDSHHIIYSLRKWLVHGLRGGYCHCKHCVPRKHPKDEALNVRHHLVKDK